MTWIAPLTAVVNTSLSAAQWNASVRDNLNETAPAKATTAGGVIVTTGLNAIAQRIIGTDYISNNETTATTTYGALATTGPSVTVTSGARALLMLSCGGYNSTVGGTGYMSIDVTGATTIAVADVKGYRVTSSTSGAVTQATYVYYETGLTPGSNVFTAKYRAVSGTQGFTDRRLTVFPF